VDPFLVLDDTRLNRFFSFLPSHSTVFPFQFSLNAPQERRLGLLSRPHSIDGTFSTLSISEL
jgi:hypothetical protein